MTTEAQTRQSEVEPPKGPAPDYSLGFSLNFLSGKGLLSIRDRALGPFEIRLLEMEIPEISFPFDVTGGAERFKSRRCHLRHLVYGLSVDSFQNVLRRAALEAAGFVDLKTSVREGFIEVVGRFAIGEHQADFTLRAALLLRSREEVAAVFYDARVYGWLPVPAGLLPVYLRRALDLPFMQDESAGQWLFRPGEQFLRSMLPRSGWKIPDTRQAGLVAAECARGRIVFVCGPENDPDVRQIVERAPPVAAVRAAEGIAQLEAAERALGRGQIQEAYDRFREALDDERGGAWARTRLLQIGAADPEMALDTRQLAEEILAKEPQNVQAHLALASIAVREKSHGEAAQRYTALADIARTDRSRYDAIAGELAAAAAAAPIDPGGALAAYERAAARARDSVIAHRALFELRAVQGDWEGAAQAGERLLKLEPEASKRAAIHRELGAVCRNQLGDLKRARMHFERALRIAPDDPGSLEGLAETYAARGEPARAASYLARLAEQAEKSGDQKRIASLNLRLGEIWERWLGDTESASVRYYRVLDADPNNQTARARLAELAELRGDLAEARSLYETILASEEERGEAGSVTELSQTYVRLARVTLAAGGAAAEAMGSLERAVELDPANRAARDDLARLLRERGEWSRLLELLAESSELDLGSEEIRLSLIHAARIEIEQRHDLAAGRVHLEQALAQAPDHHEALELLVPLLERENDRQALAQRLAAASEATHEPMRRADLLFRLAETRGALGLGVGSRAEALAGALDANPYHLGAARGLVALFEGGADHERAADALERLAIAAPNNEARVDALLARSELLLRKLDRPADAEAALRELVYLDPGNARAHLELAKLLEARGDDDSARRVLLAAAADPRVARNRRGVLHQRLAELARRANDADEEIIQLERAVASGLRDEAVTARLMTLLGELGRERELAELLEGWAAARDASDADALWMRAAEIRRKLGEHERARDILVRLVEQGGSTALTAALQLENIAWEARDFAAAARALELQIGATAREAHPPLFDRLIEAHISGGDEHGAEQACLRLIDIESGAAKARRFLAERAEAAGDYEAAVHHLTAMLAQKNDDESRDARQAAYVRAAAIAQEIRPALVKALVDRFAEEFPDAPKSALASSLGELLSGDGRWEELVALRRRQLAGAAGEQALGYRRDLGEALHRHLGRSDEAAAHYEEVLAAAPGDARASAALAEIYDGLGKHDALAALLVRSSERSADIDIAIGSAVRAAELLRDTIGDPAGAARVLRSVGARPDVDADSAALLDALRQAGLFAEVAQLRKQSLERRLDVGDGRFAELTELLAGELEQPSEAALWCERAIEADPASDVPWRALVELCDLHPEAGDADAALARWADSRQGEARAGVLLSLRARRHEGGDAAGARAALIGAALAAPMAGAVLAALDEAGEAAALEAAAETVAKAGVDAARIIYEHLLAKSADGDAVWRHAAGACAAAKRLPELGRWRLAAAKASKGADALVLRLHGYADLVGAGHAADAALADIELDLELAMAKLSDPRQAVAVFAAARVAAEDEWLERAATALEKSLPEEAPELREVLRVRVDRELAAGDAKKAVKLAKRLVQIGDPNGDEWLEKALDATGEIDELIAHLRSRAAAGGDAAGATWSRLAALYVRKQRWHDASEALEQVADGARAALWGKLRYETGNGLGDPAMKSEGARLCASLTDDAGEKADWLRTAARVMWWEQGERDGARALLVEAHTLRAVDAASIHDDTQLFIAQSSFEAARRLLEEGLAVLRGAEAARLLLDLADLCVHAGEIEAAGRALEHAKGALGKDAALWAELAGIAGRLEQNDVVIEALATAYELDAAHEDAYLAALEAVGRAEEMVKVLEKRADEMSAADGAPRLARAGRIARDLMSDRERAIDLLAKATRASPSLDLLEETFELALELARPTMLAALGEPLMKRLADDAPKRPAYVRAMVDALDHLSLAAESLPYREELLRRGQAGAQDLGVLGRAKRDSDPAGAAALLEQAARSARGTEQAQMAVEAAAAWRRAGDAPRASALLTAALRGGADTVEAHALALELFDGEAKVRAAERFIFLSGDMEWEPERRASLRMLVASARLAASDAPAARQLLHEAGEHAKPPGWASMLEQALLALDRRDELAQLWLAEATSGKSAWSLEELGERLSDAAEIFKSVGEAAAELECLEILSRARPDDPTVRERLATAAVTIGDADKFIALVSKQLEHAADPASRSDLAIRYAGVLESQFVNAEAALGLLRDAFRMSATLALAGAVRRLLEASGQGAELVAMIEEGADSAAPEERAALLALAGEMVESEPAKAFALYRQAVELSPAQARARTFCLDYAQKNEMWQDAVELLQLTATNDAAGHEMLLRAATIARDKLNDTAREIALLEAAVKAQPRDVTASLRLLELQLAADDLDGALATLRSTKGTQARQVDVATKLAEALRGAGRSADAMQVSEWLAEHHPQSLAASDYRLARARASNDAATLLHELGIRLAHPAVFDDDERATLHAEAASAAMALGDRPGALAHFVGAAQKGALLEPAKLFDAVLIADEQNDAGSSELLVSRAAAKRSSIAAAVEEAPVELQPAWLALVGRLHAAAGDRERALEAHREAVTRAVGMPPAASAEALRRAYEQSGDWNGLASLYGKMVEHSAGEQKADILYAIGVLWRDRLLDEAKASQSFDACLSLAPDHAGGQLARGLMSAAQKRYAEALPLLVSRVRVSDAETPKEQLLALMEALRETGHSADALDVLEVMSQRLPEEAELHARRAEILETLGRADDAQSAWAAYATAAAASGNPDELAPVRQRLARVARERGDIGTAIYELSEALRLKPEWIEVAAELRLLHEQAGQWHEAAALREGEAARLTDPAARAAAYAELARIYRDELTDIEKAAAALERALEHEPNHPVMLRDLLALHERAGDWTKFLALGERLLAVVAEPELDADIFARLARAYEEAANDPGRAKEFYSKAATRDPKNEALKAKHRELARLTGDFVTWAQAEEQALAAVTDEDEKLSRYQELAEVYLKNIGDVGRATAVLAAAHQVRPNDTAVLRQLADISALDAGSYERAAALYTELLLQNPLEPDVIRIRARLAGQMNDTDRAYGHYAALLALEPRDEEALEYVGVCRNARAAGPQRALEDADRAGLIHPDQAGPAEDLYAPLARFAELTQQGDLARRGISAGDQLAADDPRSAWMAPTLQALGVADASLFEWRAGGYACETELVGGAAALVLGTPLCAAPDRQRTFLVARAAELYRTGHTLCERLSDYDLAGLVAAICAAIQPGLSAPGATMNSAAWSGIIGAPMTDEIRAQLAPRVQAYLEAAPSFDLGRWRRGALATAARVAFAVSCDVAEALDAMLRMRGFDDLTDEQRRAVLQESPEELDLLRFALSDAYFATRQALGLALRRQG